MSEEKNRLSDLGEVKDELKLIIEVLEDKKGNDIRIFDVREQSSVCLLYTSPSPRDLSTSRMPSSA